MIAKESASERTRRSARTASAIALSGLPALVQMAAKNRRLAGISKLVAAAAVTSSGNPYRRVRVWLVDRPRTMGRQQL
jgi:hypothetical protein